MANSRNTWCALCGKRLLWVHASWDLFRIFGCEQGGSAGRVPAHKRCYARLCKEQGIDPVDGPAPYGYWHKYKTG